MTSSVALFSNDVTWTGEVLNALESLRSTKPLTKTEFKIINIIIIIAVLNRNDNARGGENRYNSQTQRSMTEKGQVPRPQDANHAR